MGIVIAVLHGLRELRGTFYIYALATVLPSAVATIVYLRFNLSAPVWLLPLLFVWACVATLAAMFIGFFAAVDYPGPGNVTMIYLVAIALGQFLGSTVSLSVVYGAAGHVKRPLMVAIAPITQLIAFLAVAFLVSIPFAP